MGNLPGYCLDSGELRAEKKDYFQGVLDDLNGHKNDLVANVEQEPQTRFIVQVSHGVVQQDLETIAGEKQEDEANGFHALIKDEMDVAGVIQEAQALVDAGNEFWVVVSTAHTFRLIEDGYVQLSADALAC